MYVGVHVPSNGNKRRSHHRRHRHHHRHQHQPGIAEEASPADNCTLWIFNKRFLVHLFSQGGRPPAVLIYLYFLMICIYFWSGHSTVATRSIYLGWRGRRRWRNSRVPSAFLRNGRTLLQSRRRRSRMERNGTVSSSPCLEMQSETASHNIAYRAVQICLPQMRMKRWRESIIPADLI